MHNLGLCCRHDEGSKKSSRKDTCMYVTTTACCYVVCVWKNAWCGLGHRYFHINAGYEDMVISVSTQISQSLGSDTTQHHQGRC